MDGISQPKLVEQPPAVLSRDELQALMKVTTGDGFAKRRDHALLRFLLDTGARRSEVVSLGLRDVDLDDGVAYLVGKGDKPRVVAFGAKTTRALDRYLRERERHDYEHLDCFFIGTRGPLNGKRPRPNRSPLRQSRWHRRAARTPTSPHVPTSGSLTAEPKVTSCDSLDGPLASWSTGMGHPLPPSEPATLTATTRSVIGSDDLARRHRRPQLFRALRLVRRHHPGRGGAIAKGCRCGSSLVYLARTAHLLDRTAPAAKRPASATHPRTSGERARPIPGVEVL